SAASKSAFHTIAQRSHATSRMSAVAASRAASAVGCRTLQNTGTSWRSATSCGGPSQTGHESNGTVASDRDELCADREGVEARADLRHVHLVHRDDEIGTVFDERIRPDDPMARAGDVLVPLERVDVDRQID